MFKFTFLVVSKEYKTEPKESPTKIISVNLSKISEKFLEYEVKQIILILFFFFLIFVWFLNSYNSIKNIVSFHII